MKRLQLQIRSSIVLVAGFWILAGAHKAQAHSGIASYDQHTDAFITAARYEPRGALLSVMNPRTGRSVLVRVTDRGPFNGNRVLDLSTGAFRALFGGLGRGTGPVTYQVVSGGHGAQENDGIELSSRSGNRYRSHRRAFRHQAFRHRTSYHRAFRHWRGHRRHGR